MNRNVLIGILIVVLVIIGFLASRPEITPPPEEVNVVTVTRPLPAGYVLMPEDLAFQSQAAPPSTTLTSPSSAIGHILQRDVSLGETLREEDVRPVLSERGWFTNRAVVRLSVRAGEDSFCVGCKHNLWIGRKEQGRTTGDFGLVTDNAIVIAAQTDEAMDLSDPEQPREGFAVIDRGDVVGSVLVALEPEDEYEVLEALERGGYTTRLTRAAEVSWLPPTATPLPTNTPIVTYTPFPTFTPLPTLTPWPTGTPAPTPTVVTRGVKALAWIRNAPVTWHQWNPQFRNPNDPDENFRVQENGKYIAVGKSLFNEVSYHDTVVLCEVGLTSTLEDPGEVTVDFLLNQDGCVAGEVLDTGSQRLVINASPNIWVELERAIHGENSKGLDRGIISTDAWLFRLEESVNP